MELYIIMKLIAITLSIIILNFSLFLMFKIYKIIYGSEYRVLWWTTFTFIMLFYVTSFFILHGVVTENINMSESIIPVVFFGFSLFVLIVIYIGHKTVFDLKNSTVSKKYLNKVVQTMSSFLVVTNADHEAVLINDEVCDAMGKSREEILGSKIQQIFEGISLVCPMTDGLNDLHKSMKATMKLHSGDSMDVLVSVGRISNKYGKVDGFVFQGFENFQKRIEDLYSFHRSILNSSDFAIMATNMDGIVTGLNPAAADYFGYREREMIDKLCVYDLHDQEDIQRYLNETKYVNSKKGFKVFSNIIDEDEGITREMQMTRKNGEKFPAIVTINAIRNEQEILGYFEIIVDITEKKKAENDLKKANEELKDFAHIVSHDLKAPLRAIGTLASWLQDDYADKIDKEGQEQFQLLRSRVIRMENLINGILEYSRVGRLMEQSAELDLNSLVANVKDSIVPQIGFEVQIEKPLPALSIDRTRMQQIFQNIISNSVKYMDKAQGKIIIGCEKESGFWKFSVADNGPGIEEQYFDKVFQIFQTLNPRDEMESTGVGLAVVKKSVELYGGKVWIDSVPKKGTTFFFTLPEN